MKQLKSTELVSAKMSRIFKKKKKIKCEICKEEHTGCVPLNMKCRKLHGIWDLTGI